MEPNEASDDARQLAPFDDGKVRQNLRRRLRTWFQANARDLPWRRTRDPYQIWVSEIMLQQTQVATVIPYFERFVERFPNVAELAKADQQDVLCLWEGLGYYRRARQLHDAAQVIMQRHDGVFPLEVEAVRALPGIGRYTAGAILSIAIDAREPILEANTIRLLSRLSAYREDPRRGAGQKHLWKLAENLLPRKQSGLFNQALMELGSAVCVPRNPDCRRCPARDVCQANQMGLVEEIPALAKKTNYEEVQEVAVVMLRGGKVLLRQCGTGERWEGLWDFPRFEMPPSTNGNLAESVSGRVLESTGLTVGTGAVWHKIKYGVTRFRIQLVCYKTAEVLGRTKANGTRLKWVKPHDLVEYPLCVTGRKISRRLLSESR